jgi:WD40 repeat protein
MSLRYLFRYFLLLTLIVILSACQQDSPAIPTMSLATNTSESVSTPPPTTTILPITPVHTPTPLSRVIGIGNSAGLHPLLTIGKGTITAAPIYSPDGDQLAVPTAAGVYLYDAGSLDEIIRLPQPASFIAFSPNGDLLATSSVEGVLIWDTADGSRVSELVGNTSDFPWELTFSPDGEKVAAATSGNTIWIWSVRDGELLYTLEGNRLVFAPSNEMMAVLLYGDPHQVLLYDSTGETLVNQWPGQQMGFLPGDRLWIEKDSAVRVYDVANDTVTAPFTGSHAAFSPDGNSLALFSAGTISLFDVQKGRRVQTIVGNFAEVDGLTFSPDGTIMAGRTSVATCPDCIEYQNSLAFWRVADGARIFGIDFVENPFLPGFSPDSSSIAAATPDGVDFYETGDGTLFHSLIDFSFYISGVAFSPGGEILAIGRGLPFSNVSLWDLASGEEIMQLDKPEAYSTSSSLDIAFSPDGKILAMGDAFWQVVDGERLIDMELNMVDRHHSAASSMAISPDGENLAVGFGQSGLSLLDLSKGSFIQELEGFEAWVTSLSFSPDGGTLASVYAFPNYVVQLWKLPGGERRYTMEGENFWRAVFSPIGNILATIAVREEGGELTGTPAGVVQLWQASDGESIRELKIGDASSLAFSPDGSVMASGSADGILRLWNVESGELLIELAGHSDYITSLAFSPDGEVLATGSNDGTVMIWGIAELLQ